MVSPMLASLELFNKPKGLFVTTLPLLGRKERGTTRNWDSLTYFPDIGGPISYINP